MITLTDAITVRNINRLKVQAVKYEQNEGRGQEWAEVWCDYGFMDGGTFYAQTLPGTETALLYFKFENGFHPLSPGTMLGRCNVCDKWFFQVSGDCDEPGCTGTIEPFPSYNRFRNKIDASPERDVFAATDAFLTNEPAGEGTRFPSLDDLTDVGPLVEGTP